MKKKITISVKRVIDPLFRILCQSIAGCMVVPIVFLTVLCFKEWAMLRHGFTYAYLVIAFLTLLLNFYLHTLTTNGHPFIGATIAVINPSLIVAILWAWVALFWNLFYKNIYIIS